MSAAPKELRGPHAQALRSTLLEVIDFASLAAALLGRDEEQPREKALSAGNARAIRRRVGELEASARELMARFDLPERAPNVRGELRAYSSKIWADLIDSQSRAVRRYGPPPDWYAERLDPILDRMAALAHEILYYSREPDAE